MYEEKLINNCGNYTPEEAEKIGWTAVKQILHLQEKLIHSVYPTISRNEFIKNYLRSKENHFQSEEELKDYVSSLFNKLEDIVFSKLKKPKGYIKPNIIFYSDPYRFLGEASFGDIIKGIGPTFYVNTANWKTVVKSDYVPFTLHEALPGHCLHAQYLLRYKGKSIPDYVKLFHFNDTAEAIGLFSEGLFNEKGIMSHTREGHILEDFSRLNYRMWRALRCIVDVGIHIKGYSETDCLNLMKTYCTHEDDILINEIQRYADNPGQACSYYIGYSQLERCVKNHWKDRYKFYQCLLENSMFDMETIINNCSV